MDQNTNFDLKVVEGWDKAYKVYFDEKNNFVEDTISVRPLLFAIIEIIWLILPTRGPLIEFSLLGPTTSRYLYTGISGVVV